MYESAIILVSVVIASSSSITTSASSLLASLIEVGSSLRVIWLSLLASLSRLRCSFLFASYFFLNSLESLVVLFNDHFFLLLRLLVGLDWSLSLLLRQLLLGGSQVRLSDSILGSSSHKVWYLSNLLFLVVGLIKFTIKIVPLHTSRWSKACIQLSLRKY